MTHTYIIAEAGANHNRDLLKALQLIEYAAVAGADAVKFQFYTEELYSKQTKDGIRELIESVQTPYEWIPELKNICDGFDIEFLATPFDQTSLDLYVAAGANKIKVAGFESSDPRFLKMIAAKQLPMIISLGITTEIGKSLFERASASYDIIRTVYPNPDITFLHCNNGYPTPLDEVNLLELKDIRNLRTKVGLSDHTESTLTPALAVTLGATCIEKHFTLDKNLPGPDHPFALNIKELTEMIQNVRDAEKMLTHRPLNLTASEKRHEFAMRSVIASQNIKNGEKLTEENTTTQRPFYEGNTPARRYYEILGEEATQDFKKGDFVVFN